MKKILFLVTILLSIQIVFAQQPRRSISLDSLAVWEVRKMSYPLSLDSNQRKYLVGAIKNQLIELNKLNTTKQNSDSIRTSSIKRNTKEFNQIVKQILTKAQFEKYKTMQEESKKEFIEKQNKRKTKVKSLNIAD